MKQGLPVGYEDFKEIIEHNLYYVDETLMIKRLIDRHRKVNLFTRPRRFGKTLNLSMLKYFFERHWDEKGDGDDSSYLFRGLKIAACGGQYMAFQGKYPVINLSLKSAMQPDFEMAYNSLEFGVITGCLRLSKESIFTGLNDLDIYSIMIPWYA